MEIEKMKFFFFVYLAFHLILFSSVLGYSWSPGNCVSPANATTGHLSTPGPIDYGNFAITLSQTGYFPGTTLAVEILGDGVTEFKGFIIYALDANNNRRGSFTTQPGVDVPHAVNCPGDPYSTVGQTEQLNITSLNLAWTAPNDPNAGVLTFQGVVVINSSSWYYLGSQTLTPTPIIPIANPSAAIAGSILVVITVVMIFVAIVVAICAYRIRKSDQSN